MSRILRNNSRKQSVEQLRSRIYNVREEQQEVINQIIDRKLLKIRKKKEWTGLLLHYALVIAIVFFIFHYILGIAFVKHNSMYPNVNEGDVVIYLRLGEITAGDIVIAHVNQEDNYIKRVIATEGDEVDINDTGILCINGTEIEEEYIFTPTYPKNPQLMFPLKIGKNEVFVLGDNRVVSKDSREIGAISHSDIEGKVITIFRFGQSVK